MEALTAFLEANGLLALAFTFVAGVLKYYITRDITDVRSGMKQNSVDIQALRDYVHSCEEQIEKDIQNHDKELAMLKLDTKHMGESLAAKLEVISSTLDRHVKWEEEKLEKQQEFMGYVYRHLGNGDFAGQK